MAHRKTLVVEDSPSRQVFFRSAMPSATLVSSPERAIDALRAREFDLIFLDGNLNSRNFDGTHVARYLASIGYKGRVVIHSSNRWLAGLMEGCLLKANVVVRRAEFDTPAFDQVAITLELPCRLPDVFDLGEID